MAAEAGIRYSLGHGGKSPLSILETGPGGCAFADFDRDGRLDVVLVGPPRCALYRNVGGGRFEEVTEKAGLTRAGQWMGCTVGDYDNDGDPDLLLTGYRICALMRNERMRFRDVTRAAGLRTDLWTTSAAFADVDQDGWLDLYVGAYVDYRLGDKDLCPRMGIATACGPEIYSPERGQLYRNLGGRRFQDVTRAAGLHRSAGKTWGVAFADFDDDGRPDLYLANDQTPGNLYHNLGALRFREIGTPSGTAYDAQGNVQGGMGVDWGDLDADGRLDLFVTTYAYQVKELYRNEGGNSFRTVGRERGVAEPTHPYVAFGGGFLDADNDGDLDLLIANGHVRDNAHLFDAAETYRQPLQLLLSQGEGTFADGSQHAGEPFRIPLVGRGVAFGDFDNDGRTDALVMDLEGAVRLLRNETETGSAGWLTIRLDGGPSNREGIGARVTVTGDGKSQIREVARGRSVLSASDAAAHFGLGNDSINRVQVQWTDGRKEEWTGLDINRKLTLKRGTGSTIRK